MTLLESDGRVSYGKSRGVIANAQVIPDANSASVETLISREADRPDGTEWRKPARIGSRYASVTRRYRPPA